LWTRRRSHNVESFKGSIIWCKETRWVAPCRQVQLQPIRRITPCCLFIPHWSLAQERGSKRKRATQTLEDRSVDAPTFAAMRTKTVGKCAPHYSYATRTGALSRLQLSEAKNWNPLDAHERIRSRGPCRNRRPAYVCPEWGQPRRNNAVYYRVSLPQLHSSHNRCRGQESGVF
jgi:hypothetical protein